jgi:hypothetical protein
MGKWIKRVGTTPIESPSQVIDDLSTTVNDRKNAPSIRATREGIADAWEVIYPIGSIYMSVNNVDPSALFGGTWQQIKDRFLLACGDTYSNGATGGEATHTLTINELPSHYHIISNYNTSDEPEPGNVRVFSTEKVNPNFTPPETTTTGNTGAGEPFTNMPPYLAVNVWVRTA